MAHANLRINEDGDDAANRAAEERVRFSEFLVAARQRARCTLDDIALVTKVPARHLEALEQGRVDELPRGVYRRAIVRTYSAAVGLDASLVLERFAQVFGSDTAFSEWQMVPPPARPRPAAAVVRQSPPPATLVRHPAPGQEPATLVAPRRVVASQATRTTPAKRDRLRARWAGAIVAAAVLTTISAYVALRPEASQRQVVTPAPAASSQPANLVPAVPTPVRASGPIGRDAATSAPTLVRTVSDADTARSVADQVTPSAIETRLVVTSEPSGARVTVDGVGWGVTPVTIRHLSPGVKVIRVTKDGYVGQEREVRLGEAGAIAAQLTLPPRD